MLRAGGLLCVATLSGALLTAAPADRAIERDLAQAELIREWIGAHQGGV